MVEVMEEEISRFEQESAKIGLNLHWEFHSISCKITKVAFNFKTFKKCLFCTVKRDDKIPIFQMLCNR